jgi:acetylornithine deacetylase
MYGRGTCDMKGAIAAMLCAAAAVDRTRLRKPLYLAFTFEEEIGCHGAKLLETTTPLSAEHCIIGEPTGLRPVTLHKGYLTAVCDFRGVPCHSSDPDQGASAVHAAARAVDGLLGLAGRWKERADPRCGLTPAWTTMNIGTFQGGTARNIVPEAAAFTIETRPLPSTDTERLVDELREVLALAAASVPGVSFELGRIEQDQSFHTADDAPLTAWLVERTGHPPATVPFYTEAAIFNRMGAATVVCGPGEIAQAHRVDEWVELDALEAASDLYRAAIEEFCT